MGRICGWRPRRRPVSWAMASRRPGLVLTWSGCRPRRCSLMCFKEICLRSVSPSLSLLRGRRCVLGRGEDSAASECHRSHETWDSVHGWHQPTLASLIVTVHKLTFLSIVYVYEDQWMAFPTAELKLATIGTKNFLLVCCQFACWLMELQLPSVISPPRNVPTGFWQRGVLIRWPLLLTVNGICLRCLCRPLLRRVTTPMRLSMSKVHFVQMLSLLLDCDEEETLK